MATLSGSMAATMQSPEQQNSIRKDSTATGPDSPPLFGSHGDAAMQHVSHINTDFFFLQGQESIRVSACVYNVFFDHVFILHYWIGIEKLI